MQLTHKSRATQRADETESPNRLLLVSVDPSLIGLVKQATEAVEGIEIDVVAGHDRAVESIKLRPPLLTIIHTRDQADFPRVLALLRSLASDSAPVAKLIISDGNHAPSTLAMLKEGVVDCLSRPLDLSRLSYLINILTIQRLVTPCQSTTPLRIEPPAPHLPPIVEPRLSKMDVLMDQVHRLAPQDSTLLLQGETGTGKTRLAGLIHHLSPRSGQPFLVINCGSLSASLIESEMFGHAKGAFTGADAPRIGKFEAVGQGTIFLDEIDSLPLALQAKLLRVVEERLFEPVGSNKSVPMQARLIVASNQKLSDEVVARRFRADLFYRLNVVTLELPALRDQPETVAPIAKGFLEEFVRKTHREVHGFSSGALAALLAHDWPGNVRELRNVVERAVVLGVGTTIQIEDLPASLLATPGKITASPPVPPSPLCIHIEAEPPTGPLARSKEEAEKSRIAQALARHKNNRLRAAAELGISRMTLYNKLHKYGLMSTWEG